MAGYVKIQQIVDDIMDHPMLQDVTQERIIKYAADFMQIIGVPRMFDNKTAILEVTKYKALLPCDFYNILGVRMAHRTFRATTDIYHMSANKIPAGHLTMGNDIENAPECKAYQELYNLAISDTDNSGLDVKKSMDNITEVYNHNSMIDGRLYRELTYKLQGNYIFTSIEAGVIEISYVAIPVDEEGLPMILDNAKYINALELYIKKKLFTILYDQQKLPQNILVNTQQEYAFAVGQAQNDLIRPTIDEMEAISRMWNQLIWRVTEHGTGFINEGNREYLRRH